MSHDTSYSTVIKLQYRFNQELGWLLLHLISLQDVDQQEFLSEKFSKLVSIQTELRKAINDLSQPTVKEEE